MRNTKLWSVLLACLLLCACIVGVLFTAASAGGVVTYGVNYTEGIDADKQFATIGEVFDAVEADVAAGKWTEGNTLQILFAGTIEAKVEGSELMFGQKTIFTSTGKKLPITIKGTQASKASTVKVTAEKIACANDYTFEDMTLDIHSYVVRSATDNKGATYNVLASLYAGSGNVTLKNLAGFKYGSYVYGDNYTAEAFSGWTKADFDALKDEDGCIITSTTFTGTNFAKAASGSMNDQLPGVAAVGASRASLDGADAYSAVLSQDCTITPANTKAKLEVTSGTISCRIGGYVSQYPARVHTVIINVTGGSVGSIAGDDSASFIANKIQNGNVEVNATNCAISNTGIRILYGSGSTITDTTGTGKYGNVTVYAKKLTGNTAHYIAGHDNLMVDGKVKVEMDSCNSGKEVGYIGLTGKRGIENRLSNMTFNWYNANRSSAATLTLNCEIKNVFNNVTFNTKAPNMSGYDTHNNANKADAKFYVKTVTNEFNGCTFDYSFYAGGSATDVGTLTNTFDSCTFNATVYGTSDSTTAGPDYNKVVNRFKETISGKTTTFATDVKFYGTTSATVDDLQNYFEGGTLGLVRGTSGGTCGNVLNRFTGANLSETYNGTYDTKVTGTVKHEVSAGNFAAFYTVFARVKTIGKIENDISGGTFTLDVMLGGYGGDIGSVTNKISGTAYFNNPKNYTAFGAGNNNWPSCVRGNVETTIEGGKFEGLVYGGSRSGNVKGNIVNTIKAGEFSTNFYGGHFAAAYMITNEKDAAVGEFFGQFAGKGVEGKIINTIGEAGKPNTDLVFKSTFYGGIRGDASTANAYADKGDCTIETTVYSGTFKGSYYGGNARDAYLTKQSGVTAYNIALNITNTIKGGSFEGLFNGGCITESFVAKTDTVAAVVASGLIKNEIYGGTFKGSYFGGGGASMAPMTIDISNHFYGGTLKATENHLGTGAWTSITGTVTNVFEDGFVAEKAYVYAAGAGIINAPEGKNAITNTINGGSFSGIWGAGGPAEATVNGNVETTAYGGTFKNFGTPSNQIGGLMGGPRNNTLNGNVTLNIYGGNYVGQTVGGTLLGSDDYKNRAINGSVEMNIYGGTFQRSVFACSPTETVTATGGTTLNITQTEGKALAFYASVLGCTGFTGNGEAIRIGKNTQIVAENASGTIALNQTQGWLCHDYFTIVSGTGEFGQITTAAGAYGNYATENYVEGEEGPAYVLNLYGVGAEPVAATLIMDKRLTVRVLFDLEEVASYGEDFTFDAEMLGEALATQYEEYTVNGVTYASYLIKGVGLSDFHAWIDVSGSALTAFNFSVVSLADEGAEYYENTNEIYAQLFRSIADLGRKANGEKAEYDLVTKEVTWTPTDAQKPKALDERLSMKSIGLVMTDAIGIRLTGVTTPADLGLKFIVNGTDVTSSCVFSAEEGAFTVDMYVKASMMTSNLNLVITDAEGTEMFTMTVRVDALAQQIAASTDEELVDYALAYIQAADAYVKA